MCSRRALRVECARGAVVRGPVKGFLVVVVVVVVDGSRSGSTRDGEKRERRVLVLSWVSTYQVLGCRGDGDERSRPHLSE